MYMLFFNKIPRNSNYWLVEGPRHAILWFIISVFISGYFYIDPPYLICNNFLSQLGQIYIEGKVNWVSALFFNSSLFYVGVVIALFYYNFTSYFNNESSKAHIIIIRVLGIISGILFSGIAIFPTDIHLGLHVFFADSAFKVLLFLSLMHTILIYKTKLFSYHYMIGYLIFSLFLAAYIYILIYGGDPSEGMPDKMYLAYHVVPQKLIVLSFMLATLQQTVGIKNVLMSNADLIEKEK